MRDWRGLEEPKSIFSFSPWASMAGGAIFLDQSISVPHRSNCYLESSWACLDHLETLTFGIRALNFLCLVLLTLNAGRKFFFWQLLILTFLMETEIRNHWVIEFLSFLSLKHQFWSSKSWEKAGFRSGWNRVEIDPAGGWRSINSVKKWHVVLRPLGI